MYVIKIAFRQSESLETFVVLVYGRTKYETWKKLSIWNYNM